MNEFIKGPCFDFYVRYDLEESNFFIEPIYATPNLYFGAFSISFQKSTVGHRCNVKKPHILFLEENWRYFGNKQRK